MSEKVLRLNICLHHSDPGQRKIGRDGLPEKSLEEKIAEHNAAHPPPPPPRVVVYTPPEPEDPYAHKGRPWVPSGSTQAAHIEEALEENEK